MTSTNDTSEPGDLHRTDDCVALPLADGGVVIYDPGNPASWIQSDEPVALSARR